VRVCNVTRIGVDSPMISRGDSDSATAEMGIKLP
jgi:hypothetical protein